MPVSTYGCPFCPESPVHRQKPIHQTIRGGGIGSHKDCPPGGTADAETWPRRRRHVVQGPPWPYTSPVCPDAYREPAAESQADELRPEERGDANGLGGEA